MSNFLRQATASQSRAVGPFLDDADFKTAETGLTIANTDVKLVVNGGASANKNSGGGTHRVNGMYGLTFDATDTATVGEMEVSIVVAGALPVFKTFYVLEEAVYDALFAASAAGYISSGSGTGQLLVSSGLVRLTSAGVDDILDDVVEGSYTLRQLVRGFAAALLGKASGLGTTTVVYRNASDTKAVITATCDADGNRSAITLDLT